MYKLVKFNAMGWFDCVSVEKIMEVADNVITSIYGDSMISQILQSLAAPSSCKKIEYPQNYEEYMSCNILKSQRGPWTLGISLLVTLMIAFMVLGYIFYRRTRKVLIKFIMLSNNRRAVSGNEIVTFNNAEQGTATLTINPGRANGRMSSYLPSNLPGRLQGRLIASEQSDWTT